MPGKYWLYKPIASRLYIAVQQAKTNCYQQFRSLLRGLLRVQFWLLRFAQIYIPRPTFLLLLAIKSYLAINSYQYTIIAIVAITTILPIGICPSYYQPSRVWLLASLPLGFLAPRRYQLSQVPGYPSYPRFLAILGIVGFPGFLAILGSQLSWVLLAFLGSQLSQVPSYPRCYQLSQVPSYPRCYWLSQVPSSRMLLAFLGSWLSWVPSSRALLAFLGSQLSQVFLAFLGSQLSQVVLAFPGSQLSRVPGYPRYYWLSQVPSSQALLAFLGSQLSQVPSSQALLAFLGSQLSQVVLAFLGSQLFQVPSYPRQYWLSQVRSFRKKRRKKKGKKGQEN